MNEWCQDCECYHAADAHIKKIEKTKMSTTKKIEHFGTMNGWKTDSEAYKIVKKCAELNHGMLGFCFSVNLGNCYNKYGCNECGYSYNVDSSD